MQLSIHDIIIREKFIKSDFLEKSIPKNLLISFSGGESSAFMLIKCLEYYKDSNILVCFANTGDEHEETLLFVKRIEEFYQIKVYWLEAYISPIRGVGVMPVIVDYETASRDGKPLLDQSEKLGHCAISAPHCTRDLKVSVIHKFAKEYFQKRNYVTIQGLRYDEKSRINWLKAKENNWDYPLARWGVTKQVINLFWLEHYKLYGFRLNLKPHQGNCNLCFKKSERKLVQLIKKTPCLLIFRITLELVSKTDKHCMYRKHRTALDLLELAKETSNNNIDNLDTFGGGCFCS